MTKTPEGQPELEAITAHYQPSEETISLVQDTPIALLVGVSGAGKGTIKEALTETGEYHPMISHTTRPPRTNNGKPEVDGLDYHFIDLDTAVSMLEDGNLVDIKPYNVNLDGTSTEYILTSLLCSVI